MSAIQPISMQAVSEKVILARKGRLEEDALFSRIFKYAPDPIISICRPQLSLKYFFLAKVESP